MMHSMKKKKNEPAGDSRALVRDLALVAMSVLVAVMLVTTGTLETALAPLKAWGYIGSFVAGIFFTSVFTTAPAIATLGETARFTNVFGNAFFGACGAVLGDLIMFRFVRDEFSRHVSALVSHSSARKRLKALVSLKSFRWLAFIIGGIVIASPLPDEIGVGLLGLARIPSSWFVVVSFVFNFIGILAIGGFVRLF